MNKAISSVVLLALTLAAFVSWPTWAIDLSPTGLLGQDLAAFETLQRLPLADEDHLVELDIADLPSTKAINAIASARAVDFTVRGRKEVDLNNKIAPATVLIMGTGTCTGTIVSASGQILTCWHCVLGKDEVQVRLHPSVSPTNNSLLRAKVEVISQTSDLALLRIISPPERLPLLNIGRQSDLEVGADVYAVGHPSGLHWTFVKGHISQVYEQFSWTPSKSLRHEAPVVQSQIPLYEGNSGGPLVSERGTLIGVNATKREGDAFTFAVGLPEISRFLATANAEGAQKPLSKVAHSTQCNSRTIAKRRHEESKATIAFIDSKCRDKPDSIRIVFDDGRPSLVARLSDSNDSIDLVVSHDGSRQHLYLKQKSLVLEKAGVSGMQGK